MRSRGTIGGSVGRDALGHGLERNFMARLHKLIVPLAWLCLAVPGVWAQPIPAAQVSYSTIDVPVQ
jgi:hypothetical protein